MICLNIDCVSQILNFELHNVVLDECFLFDLRHFGQVNFSELVYQIQLVNRVFESGFLCYKLLDHTLDDAAFILELLITGNQLLKVDIVLSLVFCQVIDLLIQLLQLFLAAVTHLTRNLAFHLLNLEVGVVKQFLLSVFLQLEFCQIGLQVSRS